MQQLLQEKATLKQALADERDRSALLQQKLQDYKAELEREWGFSYDLREENEVLMSVELGF
jgi:hypothetical protein